MHLLVLMKFFLQFCLIPLKVVFLLEKIVDQWSCVGWLKMRLFFKSYPPWVDWYSFWGEMKEIFFPFISSQEEYQSTQGG